MSLGTTMSSQPVSATTGNPDMESIARRQRIQDVFFHRITQLFSLVVLLAYNATLPWLALPLPVAHKGPTH